LIRYDTKKLRRWLNWHKRPWGLWLCTKWHFMVDCNIDKS